MNDLAENTLLALVRTGIGNDFEEVVFPQYPSLRITKRQLMGSDLDESRYLCGSVRFWLCSVRTLPVRAGCKGSSTARPVGYVAWVSGFPDGDFAPSRVLGQNVRGVTSPVEVRSEMYPAMYWAID